MICLSTRMDRVKRIIILILVMIVLVGCEPKLLSLNIQEYPDKIVYVANQDSELDLSGLVIVYLAEGGVEYVNNYVKDKSVLDDDLVILHEIDFDIPGVYIVTLKHGYMSCTFPIQVIDINDYVADN